MQSIWQSGVLDPQGPIGAAERLILLNATAIMLAVIVPVIVLALGFAWWFRAGNVRARYLPDWEYSGPIEPSSVRSPPRRHVPGRHRLDRQPRSRSAQADRLGDPADRDPGRIADWKWLFIYPKEGVASVNRLVVPAGTPLAFTITRRA